MLALRELQEAFGAFVLDRGEALPPGVPRERALFYQRAVRERLIAVLRATYPAVERLVGEEFFAFAATAFARAQPPRDPLLAGWGGGFPDVVEALPQAASLPWLGDVARFEWAWHQASISPVAACLDLGALAAVPPERQPALRFVPDPSVRLLVLATQGDAIARAALAGDAPALEALDPREGPVRLLLHCAGGGVVAQRVAAASDWAFLTALFGGARLDEVLGLAGEGAASLLAAQFTSGRIAGFEARVGR